MQEYRKTSPDNKTAFGFLPNLADNNKTGWIQIRLLAEKKYFGKGKSLNEELFGLDWLNDLDCAAALVGAEVMELVDVLRGSTKSLRNGEGIRMNPAVANAVTKVSAVKDGVKFEVSRIVRREIQPTEDEVKAYKAAVKAAKTAKKSSKKGEADGAKVPEAPKPKFKDETISREFTITKYEAAAIAASLEGMMQYIIFG